MPSSINIRGNTFFAPSVVIDTKNELVAPSALEKSLAIFGEFFQLEKGVVYTFDKSSGLTIEEMFPQIDKIRNYEKIWKNPIKDYDGQAQKLSFINCAETTQASTTIDTAVGALDGAIFGARYWGRDGNRVQIRLETPSTPTSDAQGIGLSAIGEKFYRIYIKAPGFNEGRAIKRSYGYANQLKLTYTDLSGGARTCAISCLDGVLSLSVQGQTTETFNLDDYLTNDDLKLAIEAYGSEHNVQFTVQVQGWDVQPKYLDEFASEVLDSGDNKLFHGHAYALISGLQGEVTLPIELDDYVSSRYRLLEGASDDAAGANPTFLTLSGGAQSDITNLDYQEVLSDSEIKIKKFTTIACESTSATVHGYIKNFVEDRDLNQLETNAYVPCGTGAEDYDEIWATYVLPNQSNRLTVIAQAITSYVNWRGVSIPGSVATAAFYAMCMQGALPIAEPITRKQPNFENTIQGWNREFDKHNLVRKGIFAFALDETDNIACIRSITTYLKDNLAQNVEISARESIDASNRDIRMFLTAELGSKILSSSKDKLKGLTGQRLRFQVDNGIIKGFKVTAVNIIDDTAFIEYDVQIVKSLNFIKITNTIRENV